MPEPIFVNSSFRTSSTWLWEKLRRLPNVTAYYEIFNPDILRMSQDDIRGGLYDTWDSKHPPCAPYFLEFVPLLAPEGGVVEFKASMALRRYVPADGIDGTLSEDEQGYVRRLIDHAEAAGTIPVLTGTRTLCRARALKKAFGGKSVLIYRNIFHQWGSYCYQKVAAGNGYFFDMLRQTIDKAQHDPFFKALKDWFPADKDAILNEVGFSRFLLMHLYSYACAFDASDLVVDVNAIAADPALRAQTEDALSAMVGNRVDLSNARASFQFSPLVVADPRVFRDTIDQFTKRIVSSLALSPQAVEFLHRVKDEALDELDQHEFYAAEGRNVHRRVLENTRKTLDSQREALAARLQQSEIECARLRAAWAEAVQERDALRRDAAG